MAAPVRTVLTDDIRADIAADVATWPALDPAQLALVGRAFTAESARQAVAADA